MARTCSVCGFNFTKYGAPNSSDVHRCLNGKVVGSKLASQPATKPSEPLGRLAPRHPTQAPQARVKDVSNVKDVKDAQPSNAEILAAITNLTLAFEKLQATLTPRTDA